MPTAKRPGPTSSRKDTSLLNSPPPVLRALPLNSSHATAGAEQRAEERQQQRLREDRHHDPCGTESDRAQRRDLDRARGDRGVQGIEGGEYGADRHDRADDGAEEVQQARDLLRLAAVVVLLALHVDLEGGVRQQRAAEPIEGRGRIEPHGHGAVCAPVEGGHQRAHVGEDLGIMRVPAAREPADHGPEVASEIDLTADVETRELGCGGRANDDLAQPGSEHAPGDDAPFRVNQERGRAGAPHRDARLDCVRALRKVHSDDILRACGALALRTT